MNKEGGEDLNDKSWGVNIIKTHHMISLRINKGIKRESTVEILKNMHLK